MPLTLNTPNPPAFTLPPEITGQFSLRVNPQPVTCREWWEFVECTGYDWAEHGKRDDSPITNVSYDDAVAYCKWFSRNYAVKARLPYRWEQEVLLHTSRETFYAAFENLGFLVHGVEPDGYCNYLRPLLRPLPRLRLRLHPPLRLPDISFRIAFD